MEAYISMGLLVVLAIVVADYVYQARKVRKLEATLLLLHAREWARSLHAVFEQPVKRGRGRPRKNANLIRKVA